MYMRLQGYPPESIAILTTYNGQKHLLRDVLNKRCANNPVFGLPEKVHIHRYVYLSMDVFMSIVNIIRMCLCYRHVNNLHVYTNTLCIVHLCTYAGNHCGSLPGPAE